MNEGWAERNPSSHLRVAAEARVAFVERAGFQLARRTCSPRSRCWTLRDDDLRSGLRGCS